MTEIEIMQGLQDTDNKIILNNFYLHYNLLRVRGMGLIGVLGYE